MNTLINILSRNAFIGLLIIINACNGQNITIKKEASTPSNIVKPMDNTKATGIVGMAFQNILDVKDLAKYSSTSTRENYQQEDEYYVVNFQKEGNAYFIGNIYPNGKLKYLMKVFPSENTKQTEVSSEDATHLAEKFITDKLNAPLSQYKVIKNEREKVSKGVTSYFVITAERQVPPPADRKVIQKIILKVHPTSREIMSLEFTY